MLRTVNEFKSHVMPAMAARRESFSEDAGDLVVSVMEGIVNYFVNPRPCYCLAGFENVSDVYVWHAFPLEQSSARESSRTVFLHQVAVSDL